MAKVKKYPKMSAEEKEDWLALDDYVKHNIMGYTDQGLNKTMTLMLKGLRYGQDIANNNSYKYSNYSFKTILHTFMACSYQIKKAVLGKRFKDETAKFAYIMGIVNRSIADVYKREQDAKITKNHRENFNDDIKTEKKEFGNLKKLTIQSCKNFDMSAIENCISLQDLKLNYCDIASTEKLRNLINITELDLSNNNISSLEGLENLQNLTTLHLENNCLDDTVLQTLVNLNKNGKLKNLYISGNSGIINTSILDTVNWNTKDW